MNFSIRQAHLDDVSELCALLNEIIEIGGTTAIEKQMSVTRFSDYFMSGPDHISCLVALTDNGVLTGFQALEYRQDLPTDCADIATFARSKPKVKGVGRALFAGTLDIANERKIKTINATIRQDNTGGLSYYSKMGFKEHSIAKDIPLANGVLVDRVSMRYQIS